MGDHLSDLRLDQAAAGVASDTAQSQHLSSCTGCRRRLDSFVKVRRDFEGTSTFEDLLHHLERREAAVRPAALLGRSRGLRRRAVGAAASLAVAASVALVVARPRSRSELRAKGVSALEVRGADGLPHERFRPGDRVVLRLVDVPEPFALVLAVDDQGAVVQVWPARSEESGDVPPGPVARLQPSFQVTPGSAHLFALTSSSRLSSSEGKELLARRMNGSGETQSEGLRWLEAPLEVEEPR